jgi:hypothetical protein
MDDPQRGAPVAELAAAELDLDRLLTSFDVGYWRVREPRSGLTVGHRIAHQTRLNRIAHRALSGRVSLDDLGDGQQPTPITIVARPAVILRNWRRSRTQLRGTLAGPVGSRAAGWLYRHVDALHDLERQLAAHHVHWSERSGRGVDRRRSTATIVVSEELSSGGGRRK